MTKFRVYYKQEGMHPVWVEHSVVVEAQTAAKAEAIVLTNKSPQRDFEDELDSDGKHYDGEVQWQPLGLSEEGATEEDTEDSVQQSVTPARHRRNGQKNRYTMNVVTPRPDHYEAGVSFT
jgi:hypothetical protein